MREACRSCSRLVTYVILPSYPIGLTRPLRPSLHSPQSPTPYITAEPLTREPMPPSPPCQLAPPFTPC